MVAFLLATLKPHNGSTITKKDAPISHSETSAVESVVLGPVFHQVRWLSILGTPKKEERHALVQRLLVSSTQIFRPQTVVVIPLRNWESVCHPVAGHSLTQSHTKATAEEPAGLCHAEATERRCAPETLAGAPDLDPARGPYDSLLWEV